MLASGLGARQRLHVAKRTRGGNALQPQNLLTPGRLGASSKPADFSVAELPGVSRVSLMLAPQTRGSLGEQLADILSSQDTILQKLGRTHLVTSQTIFLRTGADEAECARLLREHYGHNLPVTTFVLQPPCCGAALAMEAWAVGGPSIRVKRFAPNLMAVEYDDLRWIYCGGIQPAQPEGAVHEQALEALERLRLALKRAGCGFESVVRTWFYLGGITARERRTQRYKELNRARTDFYQPIQFYPSLLQEPNGGAVYPASTGIGTAGTGLVIGCTALQTRRSDVSLLTLENPQQTPAYRYHSRYSPQSPKFSRALALLTPGYVMTWVSGTASIVDSESRHPGNIEKQTEQTIDNIEKLIAAENFRLRGVSGAGACLQQMAKLRVYIKRHEDYAKCREVCERRFGAVPTIYAVADVCRPELLVEIEGVAFSPRIPSGNGHAIGQSKLAS
jgi:enamine deaminase RidA (YjgF/YER057c/UK114 family)